MVITFPCRFGPAPKVEKCQKSVKLIRVKVKDNGGFEYFLCYLNTVKHYFI